MPAAPSWAEELAGLLAAELAPAAGGTQVRDGEVVFWVRQEEAEAARRAAREFIAGLAAAGGALQGAGEVTIRAALAESEWREAWKKHFRVTRLTRQLVVVPSWERDNAALGASDRRIDLDPGQAFGTGTHASTRLVLDALQSLCDRGVWVSRFLDVGTGSGILAIAAARLWPAARGLAIDIDPVATAVGEANVAKNQLAAHVTCRTATAKQVGGRFDLVLANIEAGVLCDLRDPLAARLTGAGRLILAGILTTQVEEVAAHYAAAGLVAEETRRCDHDPEWSCLWLGRGAGSLGAERP